MTDVIAYQNGNAPLIPLSPAITPDIQLALVDQQIRIWQQERYSAEVSIRVHRRIGGETEKEGIKNLTRRMEECEKALDELADIRAELVGALKEQNEAL